MLSIVAIIAIFIPSLPDFVDEKGVYDKADIAWIIVATALVFLMTPGLAFFYGGMVHRKNVISTMIKSVVAAGVVSVLWVIVGFSLALAILLVDLSAILLQTYSLKELLPVNPGVPFLNPYLLFSS